MIRFEHPGYLYGLIALAALALAVWWRWRRLSRKRAALAEESLLVGLTGRGYRYRLHRWWLGLGALACWLAALANPQYGTRTRTAEVRSTEIVVALDISSSMRTEDVRPSRLDRAKAFLYDFLEALDGERVGLVLFAGQAYLQMPLTTDYGAARLLVRSADPDQAALQGTNFAAAVGMARRMLAPDPDEGTAVRRVIVLVSDGENHEGAAEDLLREAGAEALVLYAVGVGTPEGGLVPSGDRRGTPKRGPGGEPVLSQFDGEALRALAEAGRGQYFDLNANAIGAADALARLATTGEGADGARAEEVFVEAASYYQVLVALGLLCWAAAWLTGRWPARANQSALA